jgi:transcriptional regulator with XRE-family HTH domain
MSLPYSLKPESLALAVIDSTTGMPDWKPLHASHPSFKSIVRALKRKDWTRALRLFNTAQLIADKAQGKVQVKNDAVFYNGTPIHNSLTTRILALIREGKSVSKMLKFMDKLYENPDRFAIDELYDWLDGCKLPITDDGRFSAYKRVRSDYKDIHSGTIDYSVGQIVFMQRSDVCKDRTQTCEAGLHFCSGAYIPQFGSSQMDNDRVMLVAINPADVVSIPNDYDYSKGRAWQMEVIKEVPKDQVQRLLERGIDIDDFQGAIYSISKDRKKLVAEVLALPLVKSMIRKAKNLRRVRRGRKTKAASFLISEKNIRKMTIGRLTELYKKYAPPEPTVQGTFYNPVTEENLLVAMRKSYGFTRGQVAEKMGLSYGTVAKYETSRSLSQATIDSYIDALMKLSRFGDSKKTGLSYPKPTIKRQKAAAVTLPSVEEEPEPAFEFKEEEEEYDDGFGERFEEEEEDEGFD